MCIQLYNAEQQLAPSLHVSNSHPGLRYSVKQYLPQKEFMNPDSQRTMYYNEPQSD